MGTTTALTRTKWIFDPGHTKIEFRVKHMMVTNVRGVFNSFEGIVYTTDEDFLGA